MRFDQLLYNDELLDALCDMHFQECTPIQEKAIPPIEDGYDVLALAQTGTGKTAAYLLPVLDRLADGGFPESAINCVIMAPTRELALQIDQQLQGFAYFLPDISSTAIYGGTDGANFAVQKQALVQGADIVIATPGRLIAHMQMGYVDLSQVSFFILDEADRMLDMGFVDDILKIRSFMPDDKQTLMFSATISPKIKKLAKDLLVDPVEVKIALAKPPEAIDQQAYYVHQGAKEKLLKHILKYSDNERIIVFSQSKKNVKDLARSLRSWHHTVGEIHSDLDQTQREETMLAFRSGRIKVLVATDIVARGIDIDNISTIINFDVPLDAEDYVHRIGRTARASATGRAITFINEREREKFRRIERLIEKRVPKKELPDDLKDAAISESPSRSDRNSRSNRNSQRKNKSKSEPSANVKSNPKITERKHTNSSKSQGENQTKTLSNQETPKKNRHRHRSRRNKSEKGTNEKSDS